MKGAWKDSNLAFPTVSAVTVTVDKQNLVGHDGMLGAAPLYERHAIGNPRNVGRP